MRHLSLGLAVFLLASCGDSLVSNSSLRSKPGAVVDEGLAQQVIGNYAVRSNLATIQNLPFLGKTPSVSSSYNLLSITREGAGLQTTESLCHISISSTNTIIVQTIPDALPRSVPPQLAPFRVWEDGGTVRFAKDGIATILGAKLTNNETEALPTTPGDARVWDQDADGHPGVTVKISGSIIKGEVYVVQRLRNSWTGTLNAGKLSGLMQDSGDQTIIDASQGNLKKSVEITPDPELNKTNVSFVRLDTAYDCDRLTREATTLFPAP